MSLSTQRQDVPSFDIMPPELKQEIFSYFRKDAASLFAVIQVNKACYHDCIGMLWRKSTQSRLAKALTLERRQHYANMIYRWSLDDEHSSELFDGLKFPLLRDLSFSGDSLSIMQLRHYLHTELHTLRHIRCKFDAAMLKTMGLCCTQVQKLDILYPRMDNITPDQFLMFLQSFPALRRLRLECIKESIMDRVFEWEGRSIAQLEELSWAPHWRTTTNFAHRNKFLKHCTGLRKLDLDLEDTLCTDALIQMSSYPLLEVLRIEGWLADDHFQQRFIDENPVAHPFSSIKDLSIRGEVSTIKAILSSSSKSLISLNLDINDNSDSIFPTISRFSNLVHLRVVFDSHRKFSRTDLDFISQLSRLQKCHVELEGSLPMDYASSNDCPWFTDEYFKGWISKLPRLKNLFLGLHSDTITQSSLQFLADSCPSVSHCSLLWEHDLDTWVSLEAPLFPNLKILLLGRVRDHGQQEDHGTINEDATRYIEVIRSLAPNLTDFLIGQYGPTEQLPHERALVAAFKAGI